MLKKQRPVKVEAKLQGKTAGRGGKGTRARNVVRAGFEGGAMPLVQRLPKLRGFKNPETVTYQAVNVSTINALFPKGGEVSIDDLYKLGAARKGRPVKVLGNGDISVKVNVTVHSSHHQHQRKSLPPAEVLRRSR